MNDKQLTDEYTMDEYITEAMNIFDEPTFDKMMKRIHKSLMSQKVVDYQRVRPAVDSEGNRKEITECASCEHTNKGEI